MFQNVPTSPICSITEFHNLFEKIILVGKSTNESTPVANLTFEVNIILPTYVTTEKVRKSVLPPPPPPSPKQKVPSYRNFIFWVLRVHHLARKFGKFNQNHNIIGNIEFIKRYTHHKILWKMLLQR